jgi:hypothetical protein
MELISENRIRSYKLYSTEGKLIMNLNSDTVGSGLYTKKLDFSSVQSGMYILVIETDLGSEWHRCTIL